MKKIISILLTLCMLLTMVVVPAIAVEAQADSGLTHNYYKWDFSEENLYTDYVGTKNYGYDYKPVSSSTSAYTISHSTHNGQDALRLRVDGGSNSMFLVPLKSDGTPFELKPGKSYKVNFTASFKAIGNSTSYGSAFGVAPYSLTNGSIESVTSPAPMSLAVNSIYNGTWGSLLGRDSVFNNNNASHVGGTSYGTIVTDKGAAVSSAPNFFINEAGKTYNYSNTITIPTAEELTAANVTVNSDGSYSYNSKTFNGFFAIQFPATNAYYYKGDNPEASSKVTIDGEVYSRIFTDCYITELEIYEMGVGSVNFHVGDEVNTVTGTKGEAVALNIPEAPEGKYFVTWYTDAEFTTPVTSAQTFVEGAPVDYYARFEEYGKYASNDFTAFKSGVKGIQFAKDATVTAFGFPLYGYLGSSYNSAAYNDEIKDQLKEAGISTAPSLDNIVLSSKNTWGLSAYAYMQNADGTLFIAEPNARYEISYRYRSLINNGQSATIYTVYGEKLQAKTGSGGAMTVANATITGDSSSVGVKETNAVYVGAADTEWKTVTFSIDTTELDPTVAVPAIGLKMSVPKKVASEAESRAYDYMVLEVDDIVVKKIPIATVSYLKADGSVHTAAKTVVVGEEIPYPTLNPIFGVDYAWSLSNTEYIPVPKTVEKEEDITVYAYQNPVLSFENYPTTTALLGSHQPNQLNSKASSEYAYTGDKSLKYRNYNVTVVSKQPDNWDTAYTTYYYFDAEADAVVKFAQQETAPDFAAQTVYSATSNTQQAQGMTYLKKVGPYNAVYTDGIKITFKYLATEKNTASSKLQLRYISYSNIWNGLNGDSALKDEAGNPLKSKVCYADDFVIPAGATNGWQTGEIYLFINNTYMYQNAALDLRFVGDATAHTNEIFVDDIVIETGIDNTPTVIYHDASGETTVTEGVTANSTYTIDRLGASQEGKYFAGWSTTENGDDFVTSVQMPAATSYCTVDLYARYVDYVTDGSTYSYDFEGVPSINGVGYMLNGKYGDKITESGSAGSMTSAGIKPRVYSENGLELGRDTNGGANKWDVSKDGTDNGFSQITNWDQVVADKSNVAVGETANMSWGEAQITVIRDKDGNVAVPKPNTKYAATITLKRIGAGAVSLYLVADRKANYVTGDVGNYNGSNVSNVAKSISVPTEMNGEFVTSTVYFETGSYANSVPVLSLSMSTSLLGKRLESADGKESITVKGVEYYPYEIIDHGRVLIKEIQLTEIDSGNVAVTYNYYEEGVGFSAVVKDAKPGTALEPTNNVDTKWYSSSIPNSLTHVVSAYPSNNTVLYNADYYMAKVNDKSITADSNFFFGDGILANNNTIEFEPVEVDGKAALKYSSAVKVITNDVQMLRLNQLEDGHTYKLTASFKADEMNTDMAFELVTGQFDNRWSTSNKQGSFTVKADSVTVGEWTTVTYYFTADPIGSRQDENEVGIDYTLSSQATLFLSFLQDADVQNTVYLADVKVEDLGEVITTGGASVLTDTAASDAGDRQAMRYYFNYATTNGSDITFGGETFTVIERGFIYRRGELDKGVKEGNNFFAFNNVTKQTKSDDFNVCWDYEDGVMTFSTYVTGFKLNDDRKLQVKAYLLVRDVEGNQFYIHSNCINRSVNGVKDLGDNTDGDINAGQ